MAKREMSIQDETEVIVQNYGGHDRHLAIPLKRQQFETIIGPFVSRAIELLANTVLDAKLAVEEVEALLVTGGTSNLRLLRERLYSDDRFGSSLENSEHPEWDVAFGAAVVDRLPGGYETTEAVGLVLCDGQFHPLVELGEKAYAHPKHVSVALVEDTPQANFVLAKSNGNGRADRVLQFNVPTGGFDGERIVVAYKITDDLTLRLEAQSETRDQQYKVEKEYEELRFAYHIQK